MKFWCLSSPDYDQQNGVGSKRAKAKGLLPQQGNVVPMVLQYRVDEGMRARVKISIVGWSHLFSRWDFSTFPHNYWATVAFFIGGLSLQLLGWSGCCHFRPKESPFSFACFFFWGPSFVCLRVFVLAFLLGTILRKKKWKKICIFVIFYEKDGIRKQKKKTLMLFRMSNPILIERQSAQIQSTNIKKRVIIL